MSGDDRQGSRVNLTQRICRRAFASQVLHDNGIDCELLSFEIPIDGVRNGNMGILQTTDGTEAIQKQTKQL